MIRFFLVAFFFIGSMLLAFFSGSGEIRRWRSEAAPPFSLLIEGTKPHQECALTEPKAFAIVLVAHNAAAWCERALRSVFEQDYDYFRVLFVDDASMDGTFEKAQEFIVENHLEERVIAVRNETRAGFTASLYRAAHECLDKEILIPLDACNWFAYEGAISRLNRIFQNPDVWIASGASVEYPLYQLHSPPTFDWKEIRRKGYRLAEPAPFFAFYASLFKSIHLPDLFQDGTFAEGALAWQIPLLEKAGGRCRTLQEPLLFENLTSPRKKAPNRSLTERHCQKPLAELPLSTLRKEKPVELVIFSNDRPMQLFAALESIRKNVSGSFSSTLLYRASDERFDAAYKEVTASFPALTVVKQKDLDFKPLLEKIFSQSPAEYVLFCTDELVVKEPVDLDFCQKILGKTGAYGFYLRFGRNIQSLLQLKSAELGAGVFAWDLKLGEGEGSNNFEMSLYRKEDLQDAFQKLSYKSPEVLLKEWAHHVPKRAIGLYFEQSKAVNLPLKSMTEEELLLQFNQGLKIDIEPLFQVNNPAPHYEWAPEIVAR